jgi:NAD(P)-dependent dehydrogenase (short-subunit alcohol dehydrogenase family)
MTSTSRLAVVTGASRGLGRVLAEHLARAGYRVVAVATDETKLRELVESAGVVAVGLDVSDAAAVAAAWARIEAEHGVPDLVVNNAGIAEFGLPSWQTPIDQWWRVFEVNMLGVYLISRAAVPGMLARGSGRIINVSSGAGFFPVASGDDSGIGSAYMASKAAVIRFTEALGGELVGTGVVAFATSPGTVKTDMTKDATGGMWDDPDLWSPPEALAEFVEFADTGALDALSGRFIGAVRHDWKNLPEVLHEVVDRDGHALRLTD